MSSENQTVAATTATARSGPTSQAMAVKSGARAAASTGRQSSTPASPAMEVPIAREISEPQPEVILRGSSQSRRAQGTAAATAAASSTAPSNSTPNQP